MSTCEQPFRRTIYNDDSQGVHEARPEHAEADLRAWVDKALDNIPVDVYSWCIAFPDLVMHDSRIAEVYGDRFKKAPDNASAVIRSLRNQSTDVLKIVADQAHKHDTPIVASMRMNDTHHRQPDPESPAVPQILLEHPEWAIRRSDGIQETALDYDIPEVREHRLNILRELAEYYDIDGIELDFTRWGKYFAREQAPFKTDVMNALVGEVRRLLDRAAEKRGFKRLLLGVQVPRSLYLCHLTGLAPKAWVEAGWLDYLIQCDHNCTDLQIPVDEFAAFCKNSNCTHHVRMGSMMQGGWSTGKPYVSGRKVSFKGGHSYHSMILEVDEARGAAANIYGLGADGVGYWNICCHMGRRHKPNAHPELTREQYQREIFDWAKEVADPCRVWAGRRKYHFVPTHKKERPEIRNYSVNQSRMGPMGEPVQIVLLAPETVGLRQTFRFLSGEDGGDVSASMMFRVLQSTLADKFDFDINGQVISEKMTSIAVVEDEELPCVWYTLEGIGSCLRKGENHLGVTPLKIDTRRLDLEPASLYEPFPYLEELIVTVDPKGSEQKVSQ